MNVGPTQNKWRILGGGGVVFFFLAFLLLSSLSKAEKQTERKTREILVAYVIKPPLLFSFLSFPFFFIFSPIRGCCWCCHFFWLLFFLQHQFQFQFQYQSIFEYNTANVYLFIISKKNKKRKKSKDICKRVKIYVKE